MSKQRVMEDLDALLDELQSSTSSTTTGQFRSADSTSSTVTTTTALPPEKPNTSRPAMDGRSPYRAAGSVGSAEALDCEGQPIYEFQSVKSERVSHVPNSNAFYASVQKQPLGTPRMTMATPSAGTRGVATLSSNLSELDSLLQELSSAQLQVEVDRLNPSIDCKKNNLNGSNNQLSNISVNVAPGAGCQVVHKTASSATKELDDLMASLSDLDVQESVSPPFGRCTEPAVPVGLVAKPAVGEASGAGRLVAAPTLAQNVNVTQQPATNDVGSAPNAGGGAGASFSLNALMEDLDKNMTQQGVTTVPKGHCAACNKPIVGKVITALGRLWHPEHFVCIHCKEPLGARNFFERDSLPYCEEDYHLLFSPRCALCNGPILDKCVTAMDRTWHPEHFTCAQCGCLLGPEVGFHERDGLAYCGNDFYDMFAPKCGGCGRPIVENFITALSQQWHTHCFVCSECRMPFGAASFYDHEGLPYCETHFHARRGSLCAGCRKPVTGRCITAMYRKYHPEHFVCTYCNRQLNKGTFKEQNDKPYCHPCFVRLFS